MERSKRDYDRNLPARRRIATHEGSETELPTLLRKSDRFISTRRRSRYRFVPRDSAPRFISFARILNFLIVLLAIGGLFGLCRLGWNYFHPSNLIGEAPLVEASEYPPELPDFFPVASLEITKKLKKGETLPAVIKNLGFSESDSKSASSAFGDYLNKENLKGFIRPGKIFRISMDQKGKLLSLSSEVAAGTALVVERAPNGELSSAHTKVLESVNHERVAVGIIESSFSAAATKAGVEYDIVDDLVDLFSDRVEFKKDFRVGDRFTLIYRDNVQPDGRITGSSQILAAALEVNNQHLVAARYIGSDGKARFFDEKGHLLGNAFLRYPVKFSRITSYFSEARFHPILKVARPHNGVDFAAPVGTPVRAVADGFVTYSGRKGDCGNMIQLRHDARYSTTYLHLNSISGDVKNGARVRRGDVIGTVGMTGLATGPHLHFGFFDNGRYVNPLGIKLPLLDGLDPGTNINQQYLRMVLYTLEHYQTVPLRSFYAG